MSMAQLSKEMLEVHRQHAELNPRCPICGRFGLGDHDVVGRLIAVNDPQTADITKW